MKEKIGLFYKTPGKVVGCQKVYDNLIKGLKELDVEVHDNKVMEMTGCLHGGVPELQKQTLPNNTLVGPEIMVLPSDNTNLWKKYKHWTQPSTWVVEYMKEPKFKSIIKDVNFHVWPVGVDTNEFNPDKRGNFKRDCFVYYKNVTGQCNDASLKNITNQLENLSLTYTVLKYGNYTEDEFRELCNTSKFCLMHCGTESQGIAYMEILSSNCPMYVVDVKEFNYKRGHYIFRNDAVSSAPYFDERCGVKYTTLGLLEHKFLPNLENYEPRSYIMENHTCKKGAEKYMEILRKIKR